MKQYSANYEDIITMPHHRSEKRAHMSMHDRAAQFAPFAALTGHEECVAQTAETARARMEYRDVMEIDEV